MIPAVTAGPKVCIWNFLPSLQIDFFIFTYLSFILQIKSIFVGLKLSPLVVT